MNSCAHTSFPFSIFDIFLCVLQGFFTLYSSYINNYHHSLEALDRCKKENQLFSNFVAEACFLFFIIYQPSLPASHT